MEILGPVSARLSVSTDTGHADVFTRLCDVDPQGRSVNVCDCEDDRVPHGTAA